MNMLYVDGERGTARPLDDNIETSEKAEITCTAIDEQVRPEPRGAPSDIPPPTANSLQDERRLETIMNSPSFNTMGKVGQPDVAPVVEDTSEDKIGIALDAEGASGSDLDPSGRFKVEFFHNIVFAVGRLFHICQLVSTSHDGSSVGRAYLQFA